MLRAVILSAVTLVLFATAGCSTSEGLSSLSPKSFVPDWKMGGPPKQWEPPVD